MEKEPKYSMTNESITVVWNGKTHTVRKSQPNFQGLKEAITNQRWTSLDSFLTVSKGLETFVRGKFTVKNGSFFYNNEELPSVLNKRITRMAANGEDPDRLLRFWERLSKNPSYRSVEQLYSFLEHSGIAITKDGHFLAYKGVQENYRDVHSGKWDNRPGAVNEMPRNKISDDPNEACHEGFHVGALKYAKSFASRTVVCKVDPEHVVCVPYDSNKEKMRVCKYKVVAEHNGQTLEDNDFDDFEEPEDVEGKELQQNKSSESIRKPAKGSYKKYDKFTQEELFKCTIDDLRKYAGKGLEIVGASKIPGGKTGLIKRIGKVRGH